MGCKDEKQPKQVWETPLSAEEKKKVEKMINRGQKFEPSPKVDWSGKIF